MPGPAPYSIAWFSGSTCAVVCQAQNIACGMWSATKTTKEIDLTTGASAGADETGAGNYSVAGNFEGPIDGSVNNPFPTGIPVQLSLFPGGGATPLRGWAILTSVEASTKPSDAYRFKVAFKSTGPWTGI